jgi:hypothetical protein
VKIPSGIIHADAGYHLPAAKAPKLRADRVDGQTHPFYVPMHKNNVLIKAKCAVF